jgi:uncharacterized protein
MRHLLALSLAVGSGPLAAAPAPADAQSAVTSPRAAQARGPDLLGAYRFADGRIVGVRPVSEPGSWRYIDFTTGEAHQLYPSDSVTFHSAADWASETPVRIRYRFALDTDSRARAVVVQRENRPAETARRLPLREETATFRSGAIALFGKLVLPESGRGPHPVVVFVHGSDSSSAVDREHFPYLLAANGLGAFIYDKRGTGRSGGQYTQLFRVLSDDVVAAVRWLRSRADVDRSRIGLAGFSQGGWVAPLAASKEPAVKFVLVAYGLAMSVAEEDRLEAPLKLKALGFSGEAIRQFEELNSAIHTAARQGFAGGWDEIEATVAKYRHTAWFAALEGTQTWAGALLAMGWERAKVVAPQLFTTFFEPFYDPVPTLESLSIPMLWLIAGDDIEAPPGPTLAALKRLRRIGKPVETIVFPRADHGMTEFVERGGRRVTTKYANGYFSTMVAWLRRQSARS